MMDAQATQWLGQPALAWLGDASARAAGVLTLTALMALMWRRRSAAARHAVWLCGILAVFLLPAAARVMPAIGVPLPLLDRLAELPAGGAEQAPSAAAVAWFVDVAAPPIAGWSWPLVLLAIWAAGALLVLARIGVGFISVRWMVHGASSIEGTATAVAAEASGRLGLRRAVRLLVSHRTAVPLTWGWRRPVILLPTAAREWSEARLRVVIVHELAHVVRRDALTQAAARALCAVQWFDPLAWLTAHRLRVEREYACDDSVLRLGTPAPEYAAELVEIARLQRRDGWTPIAGVAMVRPSHLEGRLLAILDRTARRGGVTTRAACTAAVGVVLLALPVAAVRPYVTEARMVAQAAAASVPSSSVTGSAAPVMQAPPRHTASQAPRDKRGESLAFALQHDTSVAVRRQAAISLRNLPPNVAMAAYDALVNAALRDRDAEVRRLAVVVLGQIAKTRAASTLQSVLRDDLDPGVRQAAAAALGQAVTTPPATQAAAAPATAAAGDPANPQVVIDPNDPFYAGALKPEGNVKAPRPILYPPKPTYTPEAMQAKIEGSVVLEAIVLEDGTVANVRVVKSLDPDLGLDQSAIDTAYKWRFEPGTRDGVPVRTVVMIEMLFTMR